MKCPKCGYERQPADLAPDWQCPSCKVAYVKAAQANKTEIKPVFSQHLPEEQLPAHSPESDEERDEQSDDESYELQSLAASGQKIVIYSIILTFILNSAERTHALPALPLGVLFFCVAVFSLLGVLRICSGLEKSQNQKIVFMVLSFFPLLNLISLIYLSAKTNKMLKAAGWQIGLMGAKP